MALNVLKYQSYILQKGNFFGVRVVYQAGEMALGLRALEDPGPLPSTHMISIVYSILLYWHEACVRYRDINSNKIVIHQIKKINK